MEWLNSLFGGVKDFGSGLANMFTGGESYFNGGNLGEIMNDKALGATFDAATNSISYNDLNADGNTIGRLTGYLDGSGNLYKSSFDANGGLLGGAAGLGSKAFGGLAGLGTGLLGGGAKGAGGFGAGGLLSGVGDMWKTYKGGKLADEQIGIMKEQNAMAKDVYNNKVATRERNEQAIKDSYNYKSPSTPLTNAYYNKGY